MDKEFFAEKEQAGERLDLFLMKKTKDLSRNQIQQGIADQNILLNSKATKPSAKIQTGNNIQIKDSFFNNLDKPIDLIGEDIPLKIIYEDKNLMAIDKPANLVVHPAQGSTSGTLVNALIKHQPEIIKVVDEESAGSRVRPGIVHRLDKDTSGLILVAKNKRTLSLLTQQLADKKINKTYTALVYGETQNSGSVENYIGRDNSDRKKMAVIRQDKGKLAITNFEKVKSYTFNDSVLSLLKINIPTGRTHQIRVQLKSIGHPVIGDQTYFSKESKKVSSILGAHRQMLHASEIEFCAPGQIKALHLKSDLPEDFELVLIKLS